MTACGEPAFGLHRRHAAGVVEEHDLDALRPQEVQVAREGAEIAIAPLDVGARRGAGLSDCRGPRARVRACPAPAGRRS